MYSAHSSRLDASTNATMGVLNWLVTQLWIRLLYVDRVTHQVSVSSIIMLMQLIAQALISIVIQCTSELNFWIWIVRFGFHAQMIIQTGTVLNTYHPKDHPRQGQCSTHPINVTTWDVFRDPFMRYWTNYIRYYGYFKRLVWSDTTDFPRD